VLTDVGLLSSAFAGIDIAAMLEGAGRWSSFPKMKTSCKTRLCSMGSWHYLYLKEGKNISVIDAV